LLAALAALTGCHDEQPRQQTGEGVAAVEPPDACGPQDFEGSRFTVCTFDAGSDEVQLRWRGKDGLPLRSLARLEQDLGPDAARVRFAMNAGMYDESGNPIGLYVADGIRHRKLNRRSGPGNFHLLPNGVFAVAADGSLAVETAADFAKRKAKPRWATQSGPMLVIDGRLHPRFDEDGPSRLIRNGVGVRDPQTVFFVVSESAISFGRLARFFRDVLGCRNALFLDGSVSSLWDPAAGRQDARAPLGPMLVVLQKMPPRAQPPAAKGANGAAGPGPGAVLRSVKEEP
jgi:uncharacterized protein YigE (DUF2233 family)